MKRCGILGRLAVGLLCVVGCASLLFARPGVLKLKNGQTYEGEIDDRDPLAVSVTAKGIVTRIDRGNIASISYADSAQTLQEQLLKLNPKDVPGHMAVAKKAMAQQQYTIARDAVEQVLAVDPNNADAVALQSTIQSQMRLERNKQKPPEEPKVEATGPTTPGTQPAGDQKVLRPSEINAIRQAEMRPDDVGVRIRFERNVLRRYVDYIGRERAGEFYSLNAMQQAQAIMNHGPAEMRSDVTIVNDPPALLQYRRLVQPYVVQNCATSACHGGNSGATKLQFVTPSESDPATYTNFYLLTKYVQPSKQTGGDQVFGHGDLRMVDRQRPPQSLLIQYGMPGAMSDFHHPDVANFRSSLRGTSDPRYRQLLDWIGQALVPVPAGYGFDFGTPATNPSSQPAAAPATMQGKTPPASPGQPRPVAPPAPPAPR